MNFGLNQLGGGLSLMRVLSSISRTLGMVRQVAPIYREIKPLFAKAPAFFARINGMRSALYNLPQSAPEPQITQDEPVQNSSSGPVFFQ